MFPFSLLKVCSVIVIVVTCCYFFWVLYLNVLKFPYVIEVFLLIILSPVGVLWIWFSFFCLIFLSQVAGPLCLGNVPWLLYRSPRPVIREPSVISALPYRQRALCHHELGLAGRFLVPCSWTLLSPCTFLDCEHGKTVGYGPFPHFWFSKVFQ